MSYGTKQQTSNCSTLTSWADSIGGDLSLQEYAFTGGYSGRAGKFTWGIEGSYRAALEYRNRDPRPKNIVSDLDFAGGGSVRLDKYVVGISVMAQIYSQDNTLDFYAPLGSAYIYTMTGLGTTSVRFGKGDVTDTNYKGYGYGARYSTASRTREGRHIRRSELSQI